MTIYVVLCADRHIDPQIFLFRDKADALDAAWQFARDNARHPENIREEESPWLLYLEYSNESDYVRVEELEIQDVPA